MKDRIKNSICEGFYNRFRFRENFIHQYNWSNPSWTRVCNSTVCVPTVSLLFFSQFGICTEYNPSMSTVGLFSLSAALSKNFNVHPTPHQRPPALSQAEWPDKPTITHWYGWTIFVIYYWIDFSSVCGFRLWWVNSRQSFQ